MYHNELFGLRLRKIRNHHKETQKSLADFLGVKPNQIGEMENGRGATTLAKLALLCEHYNISADYLLGLTDEPRPLRQDDGAGR
ncbi:transcriptional regulator [Flavonifractor plautii]|uniref:Helix-turn-helix transcriptional regulator n=1 Tax=Flavonifractor plautii TaxID=292800 RepID=A0AAX1KH98_FLAPL|nr:helix-turn-helix transcriptional regulator [Flavonifractor plautii]ANU41885.1 transcriptional regulator [Flavonifractor plautii]OXE48866.1 transcriptional regulator [Flavonifractor plautii]QQR05240.1 helix-turn-helix transcriptional regulator [Flavonifractor plautii]UQA26043.1 helix-turn-helix domain-containing protein [Flavonifractor plautii]